MVYAIYEIKGADWVMACRSQAEAKERLKQIHLVDPGGLPLGYLDDKDQTIHLYDFEPQLEDLEKALYETQLSGRIRQAAEAFIFSLSLKREKSVCRTLPPDTIGVN